MASKVFYRQCRLVKKIKDGRAITVSWIPEPYCVADKVLKLKNEDDTWDDGWVVESASEQRVAKENLSDPHTSIKNHRKNTGDALPKLK